ncbi:MAG: hypothetical protein M3R40_10880 [Pseudomonadota bacterium]|nr:hypothetical protein [Pseudomonadota bacterium]
MITREEILRNDWTTAARLMAHVSTNFKDMNDQRSLGESGNPGQGAANLHGLGDGSTLVLIGRAAPLQLGRL